MIACATHSVMIFRIGDLAACIAACLGREIVRDAVNNRKQQVEIGVHRGLPERRRLAESSADFDLRRYLPFNTTAGSPAVALLI
jgi:hypothetical protein